MPNPNHDSRTGRFSSGSGGGHHSAAKHGLTGKHPSAAGLKRAVTARDAAKHGPVDTSYWTGAGSGHGSDPGWRSELKTHDAAIAKAKATGKCVNIPGEPKWAYDPKLGYVRKGR